MRNVLSRTNGRLRLLMLGLTYIAGAVSNNACLFDQRLNHETALYRLRQIRKAQEDYRASPERRSYGALGQLASQRLIPGELADGEDHGYKYELNTDGAAYTITAEPVKEGTEQRLGNSFFMDQTGVIRASDEHFTPATASSHPVDKP